MAVQTFKQRDWRPGTFRFLVVKIKLTDPETARDSNYTTDPGASPILYLCDAGNIMTVDSSSGHNRQQGAGLFYNVDWGVEDGVDSGPDTQFYYPLIENWDVDFGSTGFGDDFTDATMSLSLINHRYVWQKAHADVALETDAMHVRLAQLQSDYLWSNAIITAALCTEQYDYDQDPADGTVDHTHDSQRIFTGRIESVVVDDKRITITATEDKAWNKTFPDGERPTGGSGGSIVTLVEYGSAPRQTVGSVIPMTFTRRGPSALFASFPHFVSPYMLDGLTPAIATTWNGSTTVHLKLVGDKWDAWGVAPSTAGNLYFIDLGDNLMATLIGSDGSTTTEHYTNFDHGDAAIVPIACNRYNGTHNGATNQQRAIDGKVDTYASVTYSGGTGYVDYVVPNTSNHGLIITFTTYCVFDTTSVGGGATDGTTCCEFGLWNTITNDWALNEAGAGPVSAAGANPRTLTKSQVNALGSEIIVSQTWNKTAGSWNASDQPISRWSWEEFDGVDSAEPLLWRIQALTSGTTLNVIACGVRPGFYPYLVSDARPPGRGGQQAGRNIKGDLPGGQQPGRQGKRQG